METRTRPPTQEQSAIVERVAHIVSRVRGAKPDYARLAAELEPAIPFDVFGIVLLRHDKVAVRVVVCTHESDGWIAHYHQHPFKDSMFENILQRCKSPSVENPGEKSTHTEASHVQDLTDIEIRNYPEGLDGPPAVSGDALSGRPYLHSTLIAPLVVGDQAIGSLELGSTRIDAYAGEALQRLISAVAHVLAAAIESAQIGGSVEIQDRQREELKSVSKALASEMDLTMILNRIVGGIAKALDVSSAIITLDQQRGNLKMVVQYGLDRHILEKIAASEADLGEQAIIGATLLRRQPHFSNDIAEDGRFPASQIFASQLGIRSIFCFPLVSGSSVYGALLLCSAEPGGFTPLKLDILSLFASHATIAIHNGMLLESARERRRFQEAIEQLDTVALHQSVSNEDELILLKKVREASKQIFGVSLNSLLRFISDHLLTSSERDLQKILQAVHDEQESIAANSIKGTEGPLLEEQKAALIETAEAALVQAGLLGDVSVALAPVLTQLYERIRSQMTTPWFVIDRGGNCVYANPAAEVFCGMSIGLERLGNLASLQHPSQVADNDVFDIDWYNVSWSFEKQRYFDTYLTYSQNSSITLLDAFTNLFSRIRNAEDVRRYLDDFSQVELASDDMANVVWQRNIAQLEFSPTSRFRFVIAAEPLQDRVHPHYQIDSEITGEKESKFIAAVPTAKEPRNRFSESQTMLPNSAPSDRHYQFVCFSLYDAQDHHLGYALQIEDITEQVRDEKNKAVLLSTVSHDLRTPLTAIKAAVTGLLQPGITWDGQLLHEILEDVDIETDHLLSQISSFIEMSRIDMGALTLEKEWCDIMEIVHSIQADERRLLVGHPVRIDRPTQLPMVYVDFVQIKRVLRCLLENAVHHSPEHAEIVIAVDTMHVGDQDMIWTEDSHNYLRVRVIDQGPGIPDGEQERIFKTFYSLDAQGSGLGLAISRGIVEAHQGRIRVEPVVSRGSCFTFVLPIS